MKLSEEGTRVLVTAMRARVLGVSLGSSVTLNSEEFTKYDDAMARATAPGHCWPPP